MAKDNGYIVIMNVDTKEVAPIPVDCIELPSGLYEEILSEGDAVNLTIGSYQTTDSMKAMRFKFISAGSAGGSGSGY